MYLLGTHELFHQLRFYEKHEKIECPWTKNKKNTLCTTRLQLSKGVFYG